jgi:alpha-D-xyloside xylohydrolase
MESCAALVPVDLRKGEKTTIKIEWAPEGAESYLSLKWQEPLSEEEQNNFSFSSEAGKQVDYYFIYGNNMDEVISGYRDITGKARLFQNGHLDFGKAVSGTKQRMKFFQLLMNSVKDKFQ